MVARVVVVGLVVVQVVITENMNFVVDSARTVDKEKVGMAIGMVVGMTVGMVVGMVDFLEHTLANLKEVGFGSAKEAKFAKAWMHSMNFE
jgi:ABC-type nitrate/sulfonate/bicarbonate transport system permease component